MDISEMVTMIGIVLILIIFIFIFKSIPMALWINALAAGVKVSLFE